MAREKSSNMQPLLDSAGAAIFERFGRVFLSPRACREPSGAECEKLRRTWRMRCRVGCQRGRSRFRGNGGRGGGRNPVMLLRGASLEPLKSLKRRLLPEKREGFPKGDLSFEMIASLLTCKLATSDMSQNREALFGFFGWFWKPKGRTAGAPNCSDLQ